MKKKVINVLSKIFSVTMTLIMVLALLIAALYIIAFIVGMPHSEAICGFAATYILPVVYITAIADCLLGVVNMYLKNEYVFVLGVASKQKKT